MKRQSRTCACCRREYKYCPKCSTKDREKPLWYFSFCSENCKKIFDIASDFELNHISAKDAEEMVNKLDLSRFEYFGTSYKNSILKIKEDASKIVEESNKEEIQTVKEIPTVKNRKTKKDVISE